MGLLLETRTRKMIGALGQEDREELGIIII